MARAQRGAMEARVHEYLSHTLAADQQVRALRSWSWLGADGLRPRAVTMFGDLILDGQGGWWFLSTIEGTLTRPWATKDECEADLSTEDGMQDYLGAGLVDLTRDAGLTLGPEEVIGFVIPPLFGAGFELDNLRATRFSIVHLFMGRLHEQARGRPGGARSPKPELPPTEAQVRAADVALVVPVQQPPGAATPRPPALPRPAAAPVPVAPAAPPPMPVGILLDP